MPRRKKGASGDAAETPGRGLGGSDGAAAGGFSDRPQAEFEPAPATAPAGPGVSAGARTAAAGERRLLKIGADGRVLIPADWREAMELTENEALVAHLEDGELRLHGSRVGVRKARAILRRYVPAGVSLADELIEDRRREAAEETDRDRRGG